MNRPVGQLPSLSAQALFDGARGQPDGELVRLLTKARDITAQMPQSACVVSLHHHVFSALAMAEHLKAGRS